MHTSLRLLHLTDTHLLGTPEAMLRGMLPYDSLAAVRAHATRHFADYQGILLTGDLVHDDPQGYHTIAQAFADETRPVYCLPGNHDIPEAMYSTLSHAPFVLDTHFMLGAWQLIMLNTWQSGQASGHLGTEQLAWLERTLRAHTDWPALICLHHHPLSMSSQWLDQVGLTDRKAFMACIGRYRHVRGVLWGHVHQQLDSLIDGMHFMATPSTCMQFLPHSNAFALDSKPPAYRTLVLDDNGHIDTQVIWVNAA